MPVSIWINVYGPDAIGLLAGLFTIVTFAQRQPIPMRITAIGANTCFLIYAHLGQIVPILMLHGILLPVNIFRLSEAVISSRKPPPRRDTAEPPCGLFSIF